MEAVKLPAMDRGNNSDPYVEIVVVDENGKKREMETEKIEKTLNPKWNQDLEFENCKIGDTLRLRIMDWDWGPGIDDEMCFLEPMQLSGVPFVGWMDLKPSKETEKKYRKKMDKIQGMKIKIGIKYEWIDPEDEEKESGKKKKGLGGLVGKLGQSIKKTANINPGPKVEIGEKLKKPDRKPMQLRYGAFRVTWQKCQVLYRFTGFCSIFY